MHRSGTSVVTGTFTRLGLGGPASPVPPNFDNPAGFYESTPVVDLNDRILTALGSNYYDWRKVDPEELGGAVVDAFVAQAAQCYREEYGHTGLAAVKDPRMCRLVPLWRRALGGLGVDMRAVIVFRSPVEVASSLNKRNGFSAANGLLLWLRHVVDSERHTRDLPRCFVAMDDFMDDWRRAIARIAESIDLRWPLDGDGVAAEIDGYISKPLRHNVSTPDEIATLHRWAGDVGRALEMLVADPYAGDALAVLDRIGEQFDTACELFSKPTQEGYNWALGLLGEKTELQKLLDASEGLRGQLADAQEGDRRLSASLETAKAEARQAAAARQVEREALKQQLASALSEVASERRAYQEHLREIRHLREAVGLRTQYVASLEARYDAAREAGQASDRDLARLNGERARLSGELGAARREIRQVSADRDRAREDAKAQTLAVAGLLRSAAWRVPAPFRGMLRPSRGRRRTSPNPHFDGDWYLARYADVRENGGDPYRHYLDEGVREGRNPSATFDTDWYLARYPDVREGGENPLVHYWRFGQAEGRLPGPAALNPHFDQSWYVARYGGEADLGIEPYHHYLTLGAARGYDPSPVFSTNAYLALHADVREGGLNPLVHYWQYGEPEQRVAPSPEPEAGGPDADRNGPDAQAENGGDASAAFDAEWYRERYTDVREQGVDPLIHYREHGRNEGRLPGPAAVNPHFDEIWYVAQYGAAGDLGHEPYSHYLRVGAAEGRDPGPGFSTNAYLALHADVRESGINPLQHYWQDGERELRSIRPSDLVDIVVAAPEPPNPHFDRDWYLATHADVREGGLDPYRHYLDVGAGEGRNPSDAFDTGWYLSRYPDVRDSGDNPLIHYWLFGEAEGRYPRPDLVNPHFDEDWYVAQYGGEADLGIEPYQHYLNAGAAEGRDPSPLFSTSAYLATHADVRESGANPLHHYWQHGEAEQRTIQPSGSAGTIGRQASLAARSAVFDQDFYFSIYPDVEHNCSDAWEHYLAYGEAEGRLPNAVFDPAFYRDLYADIRMSGTSPFLHYQTIGIHEGRLPAAVERPSRAGGSRLLFIGHDSYAAGAQRVLLEVIGWFQRHTLYDISVLLLGSGHLTTDYARIARTFTVGNDIAAEADAVRRFVGPSPDVVYCNTVVSGRALIPELSDLFSRSIVIAHCHELANIISQCPGPFEALCRRADRWIGASPATTALLQAEPALQGRSIETVQAFIRPSVLSTEERAALRATERRSLGIAADALVVAGCGTVHWRKDPAIFVETALAILARADGLDVHFVWVGDGEDVADLREMIAEAGEADRIRITGYRRNAGDLMCMADVFFLSSVEDPFPLVVLEAGQFGIPAVCFDHATGMTDLVARCGRVVPERDAGHAAETILELLRDAPLRSRLGAALRAEVLGNYVLDVQIPRILDSIRQAGAKPAVSIIVPNYNHAPFLAVRLRSLFAQTMQDFEIVILDDASQDESLAVIEAFTGDPRARLVVNESNSGSSFRQWQRGVALARSDVIWIAESDDSCGPDFLEILGPHMVRGEVNIAFGQTVIMDEAGTEIPGALKPYLDRMAPGFGETAFVRSGAGFVNDGFAAICTIVNASGVLLRRSVVERALPEAREFRMCGDWRVYLEAMNGGSVAYDPAALNYFRRHTASTVHRLEGSNLYFAERLRIARYVAAHFRTTPAIRERMQVELQHEADRFQGRYDADLDIDLAGIFASSPHPDFIDGRIHVLFYVHGMLFSKGGIERLFSMISTALVDRGFRVSLVCSPYSKTAVPVFPLRPEVEISTADITVPGGVAKLRRTLETRQVDAFVPMLSEHLFENAFEAAEGLGIPVIASEHNNPNAIETLWWSRERRLACFAKADAIHLVARIFENSLPEELRARVQVIPHAIAPEFARAVRRPSEPPTIVAVGRLARQKRFDLLIKAFARLAEDFPDWRLVIYGEGSERQRLSALIDALDLSDRIDLPGVTPGLVDVLERASLFVLSSEFEATGLALVEALAAGVPVVAFAACEGNGDLIRDGENGLLAPEFTPSSLARAIRTMMTDPALRARCGEAARAVLADFDLDAATEQWSRLIRAQVAARSSHAAR